MKSMEYSHLHFIKLFILPLDKKAYENQHYTDLHLLESATFAKDYKSQMGILSWDFQCFDLYLAVGRPIGPKPRERSLSTEILPEILLRLFSESHLAVKVASPTEEGPAGFLVHGNQQPTTSIGASFLEEDSGDRVHCAPPIPQTFPPSFVHFGKSQRLLIARLIIILQYCAHGNLSPEPNLGLSSCRHLSDKFFAF